MDELRYRQIPQESVFQGKTLKRVLDWSLINSINKAKDSDNTRWWSILKYEYWEGYEKDAIEEERYLWTNVDVGSVAPSVLKKWVHHSPRWLSIATKTTLPALSTGFFHHLLIIISLSNGSCMVEKRMHWLNLSTPAHVTVMFYE